MNLTFDPDFRGDRVFALVVGLGGMLRQAYNYKPELFIRPAQRARAADQRPQRRDTGLEAQEHPQAQRGTLPHHPRVPGVVDNLSFERLFGKLIVLQEMMARIAGDRSDRAVTRSVHAVSSVFLPLPI